MNKREIGTREAILHVLSDEKYHTLDEIQEKCEEQGLNLDGNRGPIYNMIYKMKQHGIVESPRKGIYCACVDVQPLLNSYVLDVQEKRKAIIDQELQSALGVIESYMEKYTGAWWTKCTEEELEKGRASAEILLELKDKIEKAFG